MARGAKPDEVIHRPRAFWDRQYRETFRAYEAFMHYRDLPLSKRSYKKVADDGLASYQTVLRWARRWMWKARADAFDGEQDRLEQLEHLEDKKRRIKRTLNLVSLGKNKATEALMALDPATLTPNQITHMLEVFDKMERLALGASTENLAHNVMGAGIVNSSMGEIVDDPDVVRAAVASLQPAGSGEDESGGTG